MNRCEAVVVAVEGTEAVVEVPERTSACGACRQTDACHTGLLGLRQGPRRYRLPNTIGARPGERVALDVADTMVWRASLVSYLVPTLLAIAVAALGQTLAGDGGALGGLVLGLGLAWWFLRRSEGRVRREGSPLALHALSSEVRLFKE